MEREHDEYRAAVRRMAKERIAPQAAGVDEEARFPHHAIAAVQAMGLDGLPFPEALGDGA